MKWKPYFFIMIGTAVYAFGLYYFVIPSELMEGGLTGIALLFKYVFNAPPALTTLLLNIPLFILGWRLLGKPFMKMTIFGTVSLSFFLYIMELFVKNGWLQPFQTENDLLLVTLYAGLTLGTGLGTVFRAGGTTGGVDIIARLANLKRGISLGRMILVIDTCVIGSSILYIPLDKVLYTLVLVFVSARVIDFIQEGLYSAKAFTIMTEHPERIAEAIDRELKRGATLFKARGAYTRKEKEVVYCIVYKHESRRLQLLVKQTDPRAFMIISDVHDVLGEGFRA